MIGTAPATPAYAAEGLVVEAGGRTLVAGLSVQLHAGTWTNLTGPRAGDTSSVLAALSGRRPRTSGTLALDGRPLAAAPRPDEVGYVSRQHPLVATLTAAETLMATLMAAGHREPAQLLRRAERQLRALALPENVWHNLVEQLSGGQQQRVGLARALVARPRLLALDDPTSELDPDTSVLVGELLTRAVDRGACCLTATADPALVERCHATIRI